VITAFVLLGAAFVFLTIIIAALYFQVIRPMQAEQVEQRKRQDEQEDTIARNAEATIGLYFAQRREINECTQFVHSFKPQLARATSDVSVDGEPITERTQVKPIDECPATQPSNRECRQS
jgi:flagellar biosynthesis/type III secretory pathway M-ring protein FliF/YscJ